MPVLSERNLGGFSALDNLEMVEMESILNQNCLKKTFSSCPTFPQTLNSFLSEFSEVSAKASSLLGGS